MENEDKVQLSEFGKRQDTVEAVVYMTPPPDGHLPFAVESIAAAKNIMSKVSEDCGVSPQDLKIFENLHSFSVRAPQVVVDALSRAEGVAKVVSNVLPSSGLIEPVNKKYVKLPE